MSLIVYHDSFPRRMYPRPLLQEKLVDELEAGTVGIRKSKKSSRSGNPAEIGADLVYTPRMLVEDRLDELRKAGVVLLGPSLDDMMHKAYSGMDRSRGRNGPEGYVHGHIRRW